MDESDQELRRILGIRADQEIHHILLGGKADSEGVVPDSLEISAGSVVVFRTSDDRIHTVTLPFDSLRAEMVRFLQGTNQSSSPPLIEKGARFALTFTGAPPGRYVFISEGPGFSHAGVIILRAP